MSEIFFSSWRGSQHFLSGEIDGSALRAFIGWAGVMIRDEGLDVVQLAKEYARQYQCYAEACGRCAPGRFGGKVLYDLLHKIDVGTGVREDLERLREVCELMRETSKCEIGKTTPLPILDLLDSFEEQFLAKIGLGMHREKPDDLKNVKVFECDSGVVLDSKNLGCHSSNPCYLECDTDGKIHKLSKNSQSPVRYIAKITAPCIDACPAHVDIPAYIEGVRDRLLGDSLMATRKSMPLAHVCGRVCPHPCENSCRRADLDSAISIMELKRIGADSECAGYLHPYMPKPIKSGAKVAIVGAGPAGLAAAYYLALDGILSDVFEALPVLGGEVSVGVPEYRMPFSKYSHDIEMIRSLGVRFFTNHKVDCAELERLHGEYNAVILANGARISKQLGVKGEDKNLSGYEPAIPWLDRVNLASKFKIGELPDLRGKNVVCVGGGFTSMDVVRCAIRLGAKSVVMLYRRDEATLISNTSSEEYREACEEGVGFVFQSVVGEILSREGRIISLLVEKLEMVYTGEGKPELRKTGQAPHEIPCDILIPAVSQEVDSSLVPRDWNLALSARGSFKTNGKDYATNVRGIFAVGDCEKGPLTIVNAVGAGRRVSSVVGRFLESGEISLTASEQMEDLLRAQGVYDASAPLFGWFSGLEREESKKEEAGVRVMDFREVNHGLELKQAFAESERCMRCYYIALAAV